MQEDHKESPKLPSRKTIISAQEQEEGNTWNHCYDCLPYVHRSCCSNILAPSRTQIQKLRNTHLTNYIQGIYMPYLEHSSRRIRYNKKPELMLYVRCP
ncbi:hypothetical protein GCK32_010464 [Trichostrongylus colubriformis]|uniref:Uncharacterized protein n=1 Tax=Trichostrongylus colubriformis TaxID=6319 RepID=A0AAN8FRP0_TRICO